MEREIMELDFFPLPHTFRGIPISKIKPHLLKSLFVNSNLPPSPTHIVRQPPTTSENEDSSPMTIFYNGSVAVFHLPPHKAEEILKLVEEGRVEAANPIPIPIPSTQHQHLMLPSLTLNGDLPIARKKSLQRFLEKRKERMITASPYIYG